MELWTKQWMSAGDEVWFIQQPSSSSPWNQEEGFTVRPQLHESLSSSPERALFVREEDARDGINWVGCCARVVEGGGMHICSLIIACYWIRLNEHLLQPRCRFVDEMVGVPACSGMVVAMMGDGVLLLMWSAVVAISALAGAAKDEERKIRET